MAEKYAVRSFPYGLLPLTLLSLAVAGVAGCGNTMVTTSTVTPGAATLGITGSVHGGQQPVAGAAIQLYAVGMPTSGGGYGMGSTALLTGTLPVTNANGYFNITGNYTAPVTASHFYIVATGGSPGAGNPANPDLLLMSSIGGCTATVGLSPSTEINLNEVTTAATVSALQAYMAPPAAGNVLAPAIGAPSTDYNGLQNAFETVNNLVGISTGQIAQPANNWTATASNGATLDTLGDILAVCVNSDPALDNNCSNLFADATPSGAAFPAADIAQNPSNNVPGLTNTVPPTAPFPSSSPANFSVAVSTAGVACQTAVALATAANFEVLGSSTVTNANATVISGGNLGLYPGTSVTGFPPGTVTAPAVMDVTDATAQTAQNDLGNAYTNATGLANAVLLPAQLGGLTLTPGLYTTSTAAQVTGNLTLDAQGDPGAVFIFQIGSTLTTGTASQILLVNGAQAANVFWAITTTATLGGNSVFEGNILAYSSITLNPGATLQGRALSFDGAVSLNDNAISAP